MCTLEELECIPAGNTDAGPEKHLTWSTVSTSELPVLKLGQNDSFSGQGHRAPPEETTLPTTLRMVLSFFQTNPGQTAADTPQEQLPTKPVNLKELPDRAEQA